MCGNMCIVGIIYDFHETWYFFNLQPQMACRPVGAKPSGL